jgi:DNA polymerase III epsilon subunit-like protein
MNNIDIIVFDFETGGLDPNFHEAIQVAGQAYNCRTLQPYPAEDGGRFCSLMKPLYFDRLEQKALDINKKTREMLAEAPDQKAVWLQFINWVAKFNRSKNTWGAPIAAGKNIRGFDLEFVKVLNDLHSPKKDKTVLFNRKTVLDLEDVFWMWFENESDPPNQKMDTLRDFFGMSTENAHDALVDVLQTGDLLVRFLKLHRHLQKAEGKNGKLVKFKGSCGGNAA